MTSSIFKGCGAYLPHDQVSNHDLAARGVDTNHDWIVQRTGIEQRHFASDGETTSDMALKAAQAALDDAGMTPDDVDCILVATTTPDLTFPSVAVHVQAALGMKHGFAFDIQAVCSGFVYGLGVADAMIRSGQAKTILLIGAERMSSLLDWDDRTSCILFGDGAGAVVLQASDKEGQGILRTCLHSDGRHIDLLKTDGGVSSTGDVGKLRMQGREVFRHAVESLASVVDEILAAEGVSPDQIDWLVPHQANIRIIQGMADKLSMGTEKVVITINRHGNTSSASVPLALCEAMGDGRIKPGDLVLFEAMGGGFTWGAVLMRI